MLRQLLQVPPLVPHLPQQPSWNVPYPLQKALSTSAHTVEARQSYTLIPWEGVHEALL